MGNTLFFLRAVRIEGIATNFPLGAAVMTSSMSLISYVSKGPRRY